MSHGGNTAFQEAAKTSKFKMPSPRSQFPNRYRTIKTKTPVETTATETTPAETNQRSRWTQEYFSGRGGKKILNVMVRTKLPGGMLSQRAGSERSQATTVQPREWLVQQEALPLKPMARKIRSTRQIRDLSSINGISLEHIERRARPIHDNTTYIARVVFSKYFGMRPEFSPEISLG